MTATTGQGEEHWKRKYYDQLDQLEQKEKEWADLEAVLKRAIGRLSVAAEGHNSNVDQHIKDIRIAIKNKINRLRLESILDNLSKLLAKLEESKKITNLQVVSTLQSLVENIPFPKKLAKTKASLARRLAEVTDNEKEEVTKEVIALLNQAIAEGGESKEQKPGFFERLMGSSGEEKKEVDIKATAAILVHVLKFFPWPDDLRSDVQSQMNDLVKVDTDKALSLRISKLEKIIGQWKVEQPAQQVIASKEESIEEKTDAVSFDLISKLNEKINWPEKENKAVEIAEQIKKYPAQIDELLTQYALNIETAFSVHDQPYKDNEPELETYRRCVISFLDKLDTKESPNGRIAALRLQASSANERNELDKLSGDLANLLGQDEADHHVGHIDLTDESAQPSIQELLIRLLEQLVVPTDLHREVEEMKARLEKETKPSDWKQLLKDVALLINSIRSRMQKEKHEFETFLQQVTSRLNEMDVFLQSESSAIKAAVQEGKDFDKKVEGQVNDMRSDMDQAQSLDVLKETVQERLENISKHIIDYRDAEETRYANAQKSVFDMQDKMMSLEKETENLKHVIIKTNRQALFDALTEIPNRLAYEKKADEEIARWKRFGNPLSLAVWDIDFFKKVNDTYGHKAGDKVLKTIAQLLNGRIRETDFLARFGGEEFVMLLPGTKQEETLRLVNDLRTKVEKCGFHYHGDSVKITVSCGVSCFGEGDTLETVFERADKALYKAKENGRNQCVVASCLSK